MSKIPLMSLRSFVIVSAAPRGFSISELPVAPLPLFASIYAGICAAILISGGTK